MSSGTPKQNNEQSGVEDLEDEQPLDVPATTHDLRLLRLGGLTISALVLLTVVAAFIRAVLIASNVDLEAIRKVLIAACAGTSILCLTVWFLDVTKAITLRRGWSKLLWAAFISSLLGDTAIVYKTWAAGDRTPLSIACLKLIQASQGNGILHPVKLKPDFSYMQNAPVAFFLSTEGLPVDGAGNRDANVIAEVESEDQGVSYFVDYHWIGNAQKLLEESKKSGRRAELSAISPDCVSDSNALITMQLKPAANLVGNYRLRVTVHDNVSGRFSLADLPITYAAGP